MYQLQLDKTRELQYNMRAFYFFENKAKKTVIQALDGDLSMHDIAHFAWAGLRHEDKTLDLERVIDLIDEYSNVGIVMAAVMEAVTEALGGDELFKIAEEKKKQAGELSSTPN